jgi:hypothetical protein
MFQKDPPERYGSGMNTKRISLFLLGLGTLIVTIGLNMRSLTQDSINACISRNSVISGIGIGDTYVCDSMTKAWIVLGIGSAILFIGGVMSLGHSARTREWTLIWGALAVWAAVSLILYV